MSHSRYWKSTAIFVTEDDAQNGPDHIDAHRTLALAISPYTQTGRVDSTFYSTDSMLHTIELLSGLRPLTQFDAFATPMIGYRSTTSGRSRPRHRRRPPRPPASRPVATTTDCTAGGVAGRSRPATRRCTVPA